jgi:hypothetical protein
MPESVDSKTALPRPATAALALAVRLDLPSFVSPSASDDSLGSFTVCIDS